MNKVEFVEALEKVSRYCKKTICSKCDFCDKATGECAFSLAFTIPRMWHEGTDFLPPSEWKLKELYNNE